jgi:predicted nucleic acid-binding protein
VTVIDSSAYIAFLIGEEGREQVRPWLDPEREPRSLSLLLAETGNVLWKYSRQGNLLPEEAHALFTQTRDLCREGIILIEPDELYGDRALSLAMDHDHPFYDMLFVAQAIETHESLITGDRSQAEIASRCGIEVFRI